jgi:ribonuclease P protein component
MIRHTFKKAEKLTNKKTFDLLFADGESFTVPPFRFVWVIMKSKTSYPVQLGISVPKRSFTRAVDRNTIKRRIRESYRKNKEILYEFLQKKNLLQEEPSGHLALMIIYTAKEELPYTEIEKKMIVSLQKLIVQIK